MCGIAGGTDVARIGLAAMSAALRHRGPDDEGSFVDETSGVGLAARRLSVIDLPGGHQPLQNEDGTITAIFNGEIYNYRSLREHLRQRGHAIATHTDTEVLVHLYEEYGAQLVHALEGMYAFAVWDSKRELLLMARDRFGEKPLFYVEHAGELAFASELNALVVGGACGWDLDAVAIDEYFTFGYVNAPRSIVHRAKQLPPGHLLTWTRGGGPRLEAYWNPPEHASKLAGSLDELVEEAEEVLEVSVRSRLIADVPVGVFLSGGVDSTLVTALAARSTPTLKTFTVTYDAGSVGEDEPARRAAAAVGAEHHEFVLAAHQVADRAEEWLGALDQPLADEAFVALRAVSEFARREVKVVVGGEGADEVFGGYPRYRWFARSARLDGIPAGVRLRAAALAGALPGRGSRLERVLTPSPLAERHVEWVTEGRRALRPGVYGWRLREVARSANGVDGEYGHENGSILGLLMRLDQRHWLPGDVLAKADRASMQASLEMRTPYLNRELVEFAASVPAGVHARSGGKLLLRSVLERVLSRAEYGRAKVAFRTPTCEWLRGPLAPVLREQLETSALYEDGWFDRNAVRRIVDAHLAGQADQSKVIWPVFALGAWLDRRLSS